MEKKEFGKNPEKTWKVLQALHGMAPGILLPASFLPPVLGRRRLPSRHLPSPSSIWGQLGHVTLLLESKWIKPT